MKSSPSQEPAPVRSWHQKKRFRLPTLAVVGLAAIILALIAAVLLKISHRAQSRDAAADEWTRTFSEDATSVRAMDLQITTALEALEEMATRTAADPDAPLTARDRAAGRESFAQVADACRELSRRADYNRDFVYFALNENRRADHVRGFLLVDAADLIAQGAGLRLMKLFKSDRRWLIIFNEAEPALGLPEGEFNYLSARTVSVERAARQLAGRQYLDLLRRVSDFKSVAADESSTWLLARAEELHPKIRAQLLEEGIALTAAQKEDTAAEIVFRAWLPVQKDIANTMGNVRVQRPGVYFITPEQVNLLSEKLQPGDVLVARKNWYLSNAGIPGFWPHALLHVGTPDKLAEYFNDDEVKAWCASMNPEAKSLPELLERRHPAAWKAYTEGRDLHSEESGEDEHFDNAILESIAEGVGFHPAVQSLHADAVGAMRPRLSKLEKAEAIERAFSHFGKPYDYNFDFMSDTSLVCSELVYKAYQPGEDYQGLQLSTTDMLGRPTLPPTDIVKKFDLELQSPNQQLDFIGFLDPREGEGVSVWASEDEFRHSWMRPKWSMFIK